MAAVFVGGSIGTALRLLVDAAIPHPDAGFPVSTLVINVAGSFALGMLVSCVWPVAPPWVRAALGPGLLGAFTTFSSVMVSLLAMSAAGNGGSAVLYLVLSLAAGFGAAFAGLAAGRRGPDPAGDE